MPSPHIAKHFGLISDMINRIAPRLISYQNGRKGGVIVVANQQKAANGMQ
jgi:hypothetical protein